MGHLKLPVVSNIAGKLVSGTTTEIPKSTHSILNNMFTFEQEKIHLHLPPERLNSMPKTCMV